MHEFPHPKDRIKRVLQSAITGCTYVSSESESGESTLLLKARNADGKAVNVRFRGVRESESTAEPEAGSALRLKSVGNGDKHAILYMFVPFYRLISPPGPSHARVRIEAGAAELQIVCQDAEWWED